MSRQSPAQTQARALQVVRDFTALYHMPPYAREVAERLGVSLDYARSVLRRLARAGAVRRAPAGWVVVEP